MDVVELMIGGVTALGVLAAAVLVWLGLSPNQAHSPTGKSSVAVKSVLALGAVGLVSIAFFGVRGALGWLPEGAEDLVNSAAVAVALGALLSVPELLRQPGVRWRLLVAEEAYEWGLKQVRYSMPPSDSTLHELETESTDPRRTGQERATAKLKLTFAQELRQRDDFRREALERAFLAEQDQQKEAADQASKAQATADEKKRREQALDALVQAATVPLPTVSDIRALTPGVEALVDLGTLQGAWRRLENIFSGSLPASPEESKPSSARLQKLLQGMSVVSLPPAAEVVIDYQGTARDGHCALFAAVDGTRTPLWQVLSYNESLEALVTAHYLAVALPEAWSWGHGQYDRDASPLLTEAGLKRALEEPSRLPSAESGAWPPPGLRVCKTETGFVTASLVAKPGRGLLDAKVALTDGHAVETSVTDVEVWGQGVYY